MLTQQAGKEIRKRIPYVEKVTVHYEPEAKESIRYAARLATQNGEISEHFGAAPLIALWERQTADGTVLFQEIVKNPFMTTATGKGMKVAEFLVEKGIDILYTRENFSGKGPVYVFSDAEIEVREIDVGTLADLQASGKIPD